MSESFSDLWASSNPVKSHQAPPKTLGAAANSTLNVARRNTPDAFDAFNLLASAGSSRPSSRPITPSLTKQQPSVTKYSTTSSEDAFGGLVSFGGSTSRDDGLTIAERAAKAERERKQTTLTGSNDGWNFDLLTPKPTPIPTHQSQQPKVVQIDDSDDTWILDLASSSTAIPVVPQIDGEDDILGFLAKPVSAVGGISESSKSNTAPNGDEDDILGSLAKPVNTIKAVSPSQSPIPITVQNGDKDDIFGSLVEPVNVASSAPFSVAPEHFTSQDEDEDDILGPLTRPISSVRSVSPQPSVQGMSKEQPHSRSSSPPPHILGRIVEMGFSVQQAKIALAATPTGLDVEAALEILIENTDMDSFKNSVQDDMPTAVDRSQRQHHDPPHATVLPRHSPSSSPQPDSSSNYQQGLQEQADKLFTQASTIGISMFNKANLLWKEGRDKVVKAYEEQRSKNPGTDAAPSKVRPRWMDEASVEDGQDDDFEEHYIQPQKGQKAPQTTRSAPNPPRSQPPVSLFADEEPVYKSPARRRPPESASASKAPSKAPSPSPRGALPPIVRPSVDAPPSTLAASTTHKAAGTEHFKLGRFADADGAYSRAIDALPDSHLLRIPLYNNRALMRLKTGEYRGTIADASAVLHIITGDLGAAWNPGREMIGVGEDFGDAVGKALRRRAEAYEGLEKWREAADDWERLCASGWLGAALKGTAMTGAGRCRRMAAGGNGRPLAPDSSKPKLKPASIRTPASRPARAAQPSEALTRVRAANLAQEKEEQAQYDLKDTVDARLAGWRNGKETNIRALIASLDMVLSPAFRWKTVGMAELVTSGQVKVHYTKAIARLHPDKLTVNNTTLEERMIANGVFGTLNEAWNAFR